MLRLARIARISVARATPRFTPIRPLSTSRIAFNEQKKPEPEMFKTLEQSDFIKKIRDNDRVLHEIAGFQDFMLEKGYVNADGTRSTGIMAMMKMLSDKEVRSRLDGIKAVLQQENIEVTKEDVQSLVAALGMK